MRKIVEQKKKKNENARKQINEKRLDATSGEDTLVRARPQRMQKQTNKQKHEKYHAFDTGELCLFA